MSKPRMILNAFECNSVTHHSPGLWRWPGNQAVEYKSLDYWVNLAKVAERGKFDAVFFADVIGIQDVYGNSAQAAVETGTLVPINDPLMVISAMAAATEKVGFGSTVTTSYTYPYLLARTFTTLDHLTKGRIGWNVVTSYLRSSARNLGLTDVVAHDRRYDVAEEYMDVVYKLWEGSWEDDAVKRDAESGIFADATKVHPIEHEGEFFSVPGIHLSEPSPQRTPLIYQAGASKSGRRFSARHGECIFILGVKPETTRPLTDAIRDEAEQLGRPRDTVKIITQITVIVGKTDEEAQQLYEQYLPYGSALGGISQFSAYTGIDFSQYDPDDFVEHVESNALQSVMEAITTADPDRKWTIREVAEFHALGGTTPVIVGGPKTVADELERWMDVGGVDGFNLSRVVAPDTMEAFVEHAVPELQARGRVWTEYPEGTLRERMFGSSDTAYWHPASKYRGAYAGKRSAADANNY